jgi:hypothetical protein
MKKKTGVPADVQHAVRRWAAASDPTSVLAAERRALEPMLLPVLVGEVAEVTAEQLVIALDMPGAGGDDGPALDFLGLKLSQSQGRRVAAWLDEQEGIALALSLSPEQWSERLSQAFGVVISVLKGGTAQDLATRLGTDPLAQAAKGFAGGVDPRTSPQAALRGMLAARAFAASKKDSSS